MVLPVGAVVVLLTMGHVFSNAVRTLPAIAADVLQRDLGIGQDALAQLTSLYPFAFALAMLPVGAALDRYGVRRTALALLALGVVASGICAAAPGVPVMVLGQVVLGFACSGMMMCPLTFAARAMSGPRFALWSGVTQAVGNTGMLLSASPLALLVEWQGWRAAYLACAAFALAAALAIAALVPRDVQQQSTRRTTLAQDVRQVVALAASPALRPYMALAFASFAAVFGVRGLWGGPWLMEMKGLTRIEAGNILLLYTLTLIAGPLLAGFAAQRVRRRVRLLTVAHVLAAGWILLLLAGAALPAWWDLAMLMLFGMSLAFQIVLFAMVREAVPPEQAGSALSANNMAFFGGAAVLQGVSGLAAWLGGGVAAGLATFPVAMLLCTLAFVVLMRGRSAA